MFHYFEPSIEEIEYNGNGNLEVLHIIVEVVSADNDGFRVLRKEDVQVHVSGIALLKRDWSITGDKKAWNSIQEAVNDPENKVYWFCVAKDITDWVVSRYEELDLPD